MTGPALSDQQSAPTTTGTSPAANGLPANPDSPGQSNLPGTEVSAGYGRNGASGESGSGSNAGSGSSWVGPMGAGRVPGSSFAPGPGGLLANAASSQQVSLQQW